MKNFLRWIVFVPVLIVVFYLIELSFDWIILKMLELSTFWLIVVFIFLSSIVIGMFSLIVTLLSTTLFLIAPNKKYAGIIFSLFSLMVLVSEIITWINFDTTIIAKIIIIIQILVVWLSLAGLGLKFEESK